MIDNVNLYQPRSPTWCPGCGDYGIWASLKNAIKIMNWDLDKFVIVYGVGCSGNMTDFIMSHGFHSLHGRALPNAEGIKIANHMLNVVCVVGDGDCYGEGGNHLLHAMRGNSDIKVLVHDNRVYGLTTGQTSPTSPHGYKSKSTPAGVIEYPVNPLSLAITQGASFVAQGFAGDITHLITLVTAVLKHRGFAILNVLQPCVTFNKVNTYTFYRERIYKLDDKHDLRDREKALSIVSDPGHKIPLGIIYQVERPTYQDQEIVLQQGPLVKQIIKNPSEHADLLAEFSEVEKESYHMAG